MSNPVSLRNTCRVLIALHDEGNMTTGQLSEFLGLSSEQVGTALTNLCKKRKVRRVGSEPTRGNGSGLQYIYAFDEDYEPTAREVGQFKVRSKTTEGRLQSARESACKRVQTSTPFMSVSMCQQKIDLLKRLAGKVGPDDRDLILNMLADYERVNVYRGAA